MKLKISSFLAIIVAGALLNACAPNTPAPATEAEPLSDTTKAAQEPAKIETEQTETTEKQNPETTTQTFQSSALDSYRLETPENIPIMAPVKNDSISPDPLAEVEKNKAIDPYTAFPALADEVFAHAESLYKNGNADSAVAYLERFRIIKPLWGEWEAKVDSMLSVYDQSRKEQAKKFEPLVLEIQNMNRAHAAYSMVAETADSLIALAPGDSLVMWAFTQKQLAYTNTLFKAQKEYAQIKSLADDQAKFDDSKKKANEFQMRYRDFEDTLHIQALIDYIAELAAQNDPAAAKYWEKNDPAKALAQADGLIAADKFKEAKDLLNKLKASKLRKEANARLQMLGDAYCNKQRKETSQIFAKAQKQKDEAKKRELLRQAITPLDKCLEEYPNNSQKKKILENKQFLEKELAK